jgi:hypothetical protein
MPMTLVENSSLVASYEYHSEGRCLVVGLKHHHKGGPDTVDFYAYPNVPPSFYDAWRRCHEAGGSMGYAFQELKTDFRGQKMNADNFRLG